MRLLFITLLLLSGCASNNYLIMPKENGEVTRELQEQQLREQQIKLQRDDILARQKEFYIKIMENQ